MSKKQQIIEKEHQPSFWDNLFPVLFIAGIFTVGGVVGFVSGAVSKETYWREKLVRDGRAHYVFDETTGKGKWEYTFIYHFGQCPTGAHSQEEGMRLYNNSTLLLK